MRGSHRLVATAALLLAGAGALALVLRPGPVGADSGYYATAAADGVRSGYVLPGYVVVDTIYDVGAPTVQASIDALAGPTGFASYPYPGSTVLAVPGLVSSSGPMSVPPYPLYASSSAAAPHSAVDEGPYRLRADSTADGASASASVGQVGSGPAPTLGLAAATAAVTSSPGSGAVRARASTTDEVFDLGPLRIGKVSSFAQASAAPAQSLGRGSGLDVEGVTVAGETIGLDRTGLVLPGTHIPLPAGDPAASILAANGISLAYLAPVDTADGVVSAGVRITFRHSLPGPPQPGTEEVVLGRSVARAHQGPAGAAPSGPVPSIPPAVTGTPGNAGAPSAPTPPGGSGSGAVPAPGVVESGPASGSGPAPLASAPVPGAETPARFTAAPGTGGAGTTFYFLLVLGAVVGTAGAQLVRFVGVRSPWKMP